MNKNSTHSTGWTPTAIVLDIEKVVSSYVAAIKSVVYTKLINENKPCQGLQHWYIVNEQGGYCKLLARQVEVGHKTLDNTERQTYIFHIIHFDHLSYPEYDVVIYSTCTIPTLNHIKVPKLQQLWQMQ